MCCSAAKAEAAWATHLGPDLVAALAGLQVHDLPHGEASRAGSERSRNERPTPAVPVISSRVTADTSLLARRAATHPQRLAIGRCAGTGRCLRLSGRCLATGMRSRVTLRPVTSHSAGRRHTAPGNRRAFKQCARQRRERALGQGPPPRERALGTGSSHRHSMALSTTNTTSITVYLSPALSV